MRVVGYYGFLTFVYLNYIKNPWKMAKDLSEIWGFVGLNRCVVKINIISGTLVFELSSIFRHSKVNYDIVLRGVLLLYSYCWIIAGT